MSGVRPSALGGMSVCIHVLQVMKAYLENVYRAHHVCVYLPPSPLPPLVCV